jgi:CBS domain
MVPALPLDRGRVLRSILWGARKNLHWATKISSTIGGNFGIVLIVPGIFSFLGGNIIGGIWWLILRMSIGGASQMALQQMLLRKMLERERVSNFMRGEPVSVPSSATIRELVENYFYRHHHKLFPVVDDGRLIGCINLNRIKEVAREEWDSRAVGELAFSCDGENTITP